MTNKNSILIVTRNLPPLIGGMERLNWHVADELSQSHEVYLLSHSQAKTSAPQDCKFYGVKLNPLPLFLILAFIKTFWICLTQRPDILFAGSGLTAPITTFWAKVFGKKSIVYIHGLDIGTNHSLYNLIWLPLIRMADKIITNSTPTKEICLKKGISITKLSIIHPGVTYPPLEKNLDLIKSLKTEYNLKNKKILISVGRLTERKGIREFVDLSLPAIIKSCPNTLLVIIGDTPNQSLNKNLQSKESIIEVAQKHNIKDHVLFIGNISDDELLSSWYYLADIHVFPVKHIPDDPEGFGMVAIEAAAHGLPTVAFGTGGIIDAVNDGVSGYLVEKNNYMDLTQQVLFILNSPFDRQKIQIFSKKFAWENFGQVIYDLITDIQLGKKRQAHAVLDISSRIVKAKKIEILLRLRLSDRPLRILEVGCGSGGIAHYFAMHEQLKCEVSAVDVYDNRLVWDSYKFQKVSGVELPFSNNSFDVVITNHVVEHVGDWDQQLLHIKEIQRVLTPTGQCYLAVPNRWMLTEPHYQLKFLSWLPKNWRSTYLKLWRKGNFYDCEPFCLSELETLLKQADVRFENLSVQATKVTLELEKPNSFINIFFRKIPNNVLSVFKPIIPTLIYRIQPKNNEK